MGFDIGGIIGRATAIFQPRQVAAPPVAGAPPASAATVSDPETDGSPFAAGPPGWLPVFALAGVIVYACAKDAAHDAHNFLKDNGGTVETLLGIFIGSLLSYRGWRGHLRAKVVIAQTNAGASVQAAAAAPSPAPASVASTTVNVGEAGRS
jgi:hypothetical protein